MAFLINTWIITRPKISNAIKNFMAEYLAKLFSQNPFTFQFQTTTEFGMNEFRSFIHFPRWIIIIAVGLSPPIDDIPK